MKRKICVRSMGLGAGIMLIGLVVGAIISPPLIAQKNGVFDEIFCRSLTVVDSKGSVGIMLNRDESGSSMVMYNPQGDLGIGLLSTTNNNITIFDDIGKKAISLSTSFDNPLVGNSIAITDPLTKHDSIRLQSTEKINGVFCYKHNRYTAPDLPVASLGSSTLQGKTFNWVSYIDADTSKEIRMEDLYYRR